MEDEIYHNHSSWWDLREWRAERNTEENKKKEIGNGVPNPVTLDHSVISYDTQGS